MNNEPNPSEGGAYEMRNGKRVRTEEPTKPAPHPSEAAKAAGVEAEETTTARKGK